MSSPMAITSGSLSTVGSVVTGAGQLTYAEHITSAVNTMYIYDGSTSGDLLLTVQSSASPTVLSVPVQYKTGIYISLSTGTGVVHYS